MKLFDPLQVICCDTQFTYLFLYRVTKPKGNVSSIICLSQHISEVRDVPLSVFIDKSPVLTTKVFYYKENPQITAVLPGCSFDR